MEIQVSLWGGIVAVLGMLTIVRVLASAESAALAVRAIPVKVDGRR